MTTRALESEAVFAFEEHEHRDLVRGINQIHDIACEIGYRPSFELSTHVVGIIQWLNLVLEPHIAWEETWLYPQIDARTGTPWATRAARFDHQQIREIASRLRADQLLLNGHPSDDQYANSRCHLFGLEALLRAHINREERYLMPLLEDDRPQDRPGGPVAQGAGAG